MLDIERIERTVLNTEPFQWGFVKDLYKPGDAAQLAATFPSDKYKRVAGYDGEKGYEYSSRSLVHMGAREPSHASGLSASWRGLAEDLLSPAYRAAMSRITNVELSDALLEVNVIQYGQGCWLGPHLDLKEKIVTQILYFNESWDRASGGYLAILGSSRPADVRAEVMPIVGNSAVLVRSPRSWHAVARVDVDCHTPRRSVNVIFHEPGSVSTMWPPGETPALANYQPSRGKSAFGRLLGRLRR